MTCATNFLQFLNYFLFGMQIKKTTNYINMFTRCKSIYLLLIIQVFFIISCSKTSKSPVARFYHNTTSYFNYYYNANKLYKEKLKEIDEKYEFPYSDFIEVTYYPTEEAMKAYSADFDKITKKNDVMIYKHPKTRWVDNGLFLKGKALFYKGQYDRAMQSFDEVLVKYSGSKITPEVYYWMAVNFYMMDNEEMARSILNDQLIERADMKFKKKLKGELAVFRSRYAIKEKKYELAAYQLESNLKYIKGKRPKAKTHYLLAQLYNEIGNLPQALVHFKKAEKKTNDYALAFKCKIQQAKIMVAMPNASQSIYTFLDKLLKDEKNIDYKDQIYYEYGNLEAKKNNARDALGYYKKSVRSSTTNTRQKALSYFEIGNQYFYAKKEYTKAGIYYDSAANTIDPAAPEYKSIRTIGSTLKEYIDHKRTITVQDSLIALSNMPKEKVDSIIDAAIADAERKRKEAEEKAEEEANATDPNQLLNNFGAQQQSASGLWYFDDVAAVSNGRLQFKQNWGERKNEDNWRRSSKSAVFAGNPEDPEENTADSVATEAVTDRETYYKNIPSTPEAVTIALGKIETALYKLGNLYDQKLAQPDSAAPIFEKLLNRFPETQYILPANYSLYRIYKAKGNQKNLVHKNFILDKYPKSIYAMLIQGVDPEVIAAEGKDFEFAYQGLFKAYKTRQYESAIGFSNYLIEQYADYTDISLDQVYYMRAMSYGYLGNIDSLRNGLTYFVATFPKSSVKDRAQRTLDALNKIPKQGQEGGSLPNKGNEGSVGGNPPSGNPTANNAEIPAGTPIQPSLPDPSLSDPKLPKYQGFSADEVANGTYFVLMYLDKKSTTETEAKQLLTAYNTSAHKEKNLKVFTFVYTNKKNEEALLVYVTRFNNSTDAMSYMGDLSTSGIASDIMKNGKDRMFYILQQNFNVAFNKRMEDYIDFYENVLRK